MESTPDLWNPRFIWPPNNSSKNRFPLISHTSFLCLRRFQKSRFHRSFVPSSGWIPVRHCPPPPFTFHLHPCLDCLLSPLELPFRTTYYTDRIRDSSFYIVEGSAFSLLWQTYYLHWTCTIAQFLWQTICKLFTVKWSWVRFLSLQRFVHSAGTDQKTWLWALYVVNARYNFLLQ